MKKLFKSLLCFTLLFSLTACSTLEDMLSMWESHNEQEHLDEITSTVYDVIPNFDSRYFLSELENEDLAFVILAYQGLMNFQDNIDINIIFKNQDRPQELLELIQYDCPEIFQFSTNSMTSSVTFSWIERKKELVSIQVDYLMDKDTYDSSLENIQYTINDLTNTTNAYYATDFDKELFIYEYIADNCVYNENATHNSSIYGVLIENQAACLGISRTFQWLCTSLGIPCITVGGYALHEDVGHAWNIVRLDGEYYSVDLTADTQQIDKDNYKLYLYMNVKDKDIRENYKLADCLKDVPEATGEYYNYYTYTNHYVYAYEDATERVSDEIYSLLYAGYGSFNLKFEDEQSYFNIVNNISSIYNNCVSNIGYSESHASYANNDGHQILHFQLN